MPSAKKTNRGALRIRELNPGRGGAAAVAKKLEADASAVSRWFSGDRKPDTKMRAALEREYQISWRLWDEECDEPALERVTVLDETEAAEPKDVA